jgi:hypothetical protein
MLMNRSRTFLLGSAVLWLLGFIFLFLYLSTRTKTGVHFEFNLWRWLHDGTVALASLSIAAAAWSLRNATTSKGGSIGSGIAWLGTISGITSATLLALILLTGASDMLYMFPQGGIGLWLIALCAWRPAELGAATRVLGFVTGAGLVLIAVSFVMIATALGPALFALANANNVGVDPADVAFPLNSHGHLVLYVGSLLGIPAYPVWASLAWRALRRAGAG